MNKHHLLFGRKAWTRESEAHREVRQHPAFMLEMDRGWHGILHRAVDTVELPSQKVAADLYEIGEGIEQWDDMQRVPRALDVMAGYIQGNRIPQHRREMTVIMGSFAAQQGIIDLSQTMNMRDY